MKPLFNYITLGFLTFLLFSCSTHKKAGKLHFGEVENNKYINSHYGFELDLPPDWVVQTKEETDKYAEIGKELLSGDDPNLKTIINNSKVNSSNLLLAFMYETSSTNEFNPSFVLVINDLTRSSGIENGSDYLFQASMLLKQSHIKYDSIDEKYKTEQIDGQEFYSMNTSIHFMDSDIKQIYYSTVLRKYYLGFILSYTDEEQEKALKGIIESIKFKK